MADAKSGEFPAVTAPLSTKGYLGVCTHTAVLGLHGIKVMLVASMWGPQWRVMDVDMKCLAGGLGFMPYTFFKATVFGIRNFFTLSVLVLISIGIMLLLGTPEYKAKGDPGYAEYMDEIFQMNGVGMILGMALGRIQLLVAFLLGGYVSNMLGKWQRKRGLYGTLIGRTRDAIMKATCLLTPDLMQTNESVNIEAKQAFADVAKPTIIRYFNLAAELAIMKTRGAMDDENLGRPHLEAHGYLKPGEWELLIPGDRHTTSYFWIGCWFRKCKAHGLIDQHEFALIMESISDCRGVANDMMDMLPNGYPYAYLQIINLLTKIFMLFLAIDGGFKMAEMRTMWIQMALDHSEPPWYWFFMWVVMFLGCHACFQGILDLQHIMHNPFLGNIHGVPHEPIFYGQIAKFSGWMIEGKCLPPMSQMPTAKQVLTAV